MIRRSNTLIEEWSRVLNQYNHYPALSSDSDIWTYADLDSKANRLANWLCNQGVTKGQVVAIFNTKEMLSFATMLACLKLGLAYVNLDIDNPPSRTTKIILTCKPSFIFSDSPITPETNISLTQLGFRVTNLYDVNLFSESSAPPKLLTPIIGTTIAYIMFTSGSTGSPKGVCITHANLLSFIAWSVSFFDISEADRFAQISPLYFDNSVFDFYTCLFSGGCLVPVKKDLLNNPSNLLAFLEKQECTIWFSVPSLLIYLSTMRALTPQKLPSLRLIIFGGEGFPKSELKKIFDLYSARTQFVNVYGPTEGTCICSAHRIDASNFNNMSNLSPLGKINPNFNFLIVNDNLECVAVGEKGELLISGPNISAGYYNDAELTQSKFIQSPKHNLYSEIYYRTGDIVYEKDNFLWFAGRRDFQIKHMGYRIELEEIEAGLNSLPFVSQAAVTYRKGNEKYGIITAFVVSNSITDVKIVHSQLAKILPLYMIPRDIIFINELPKNPNGKVDRKKLLF